MYAICFEGEDVWFFGIFRWSTGEKLLLYKMGEDVLLISSSIICSATIILRNEGEGSSTSLPIDELAAFTRSGTAVDFHD